MIPFRAVVACSQCFWPERFGRCYWHAKKPYRNAYNQMVTRTAVICRRCHLARGGDPDALRVNGEVYGADWVRPEESVRDGDINA